MPGRRNKGGGAGGYQRPSTPAAVSGQGADSARTDGGPSNPRVDLTGADAEFHGQRQQLEGMASQTGVGGGGPVGGGPPTGTAGGAAGQSGLGMDVFRASDYPDQPSTPSTPAYDMAAQAIPDDPDVLLRAMYEMTRHPDVLRLLSMRQGAI